MQKASKSYDFHLHLTEKYLFVYLEVSGRPSAAYFEELSLLLPYILTLHAFLVLSFLLFQESMNYCQDKFGSTLVQFGFPLLPDKSLHLSV